ncbi:TPA: DUF3955 domain-containing protein [Klebsiella variicola subsp. variicola]|nr:DUF3955 domain-containing protein [Klebsiella variicola subsp. variicola]
MKTHIASIFFSALAVICFTFYHFIYPPYVDAAGVVHEKFYLCAIGVFSLLICIGCLVAIGARKIADKCNSCE